MSPPHRRRPLLLLLLLLHLSSPAACIGTLLHAYSSTSPPWLPTSNLTLVSPNSLFAAGFRRSAANLFTFSVWVATPETVVWSLSGEINSTTPLTISPSGRLSLLDRNGTLLIHHKTPNTTTNLTLQDSGNLIFGDWSSFDRPSDTILANQIIPISVTTISSGGYRFVNASYLDFNRSGSPYWSLGGKLLNLTEDGQLRLQGQDPILAYDNGETHLRRLTLDSDGNLRLYSLGEKTTTWVVSWQAVLETCTIHGACRESEICYPGNSGRRSCHCPPGHRSSPGGCERKVQNITQAKFIPMDFVDYGEPSVVSPLPFSLCRSLCLSNSTCLAFTYKFDGSRKCVHRRRPLLNGRWSPMTGVTTYLKVAGGESDVSNYTGRTTVYHAVCTAEISLPPPPKKEIAALARNIGSLIGIFAAELVAGLFAFNIFLKRYSRYRQVVRSFGVETMQVAGPRRFSYKELKDATCNFSNILGRGGFGIVYKGQLPDGRTVAVKKLRDGTGGEAEFWAEVTIIARMHHLNLVRLWGFCAARQERMLVYEYVPNGSLRNNLLDSNNGVKLDWNVRYRIAVGVARAIAYLHEECFDWVLHRDIKPDNILLMPDFCPKVSDFGLAKLTSSKEEKVMISTVKGTRGYIAPEWAVKGATITAKADVYSFGMVLLDLVSGPRDAGFYGESAESEDCYFPSWAFHKVFEEGRMEEVMDRRIAGDFVAGVHSELVERMVKAAMWCIQDKPASRPSMGKVVKMLEGTVDILPPDQITLGFSYHHHFSPSAVTAATGDRAA